MRHAQVAAGLQQVGADGDGGQSGSQQVGRVEGVGSAGKRQQQVALVLIGKFERQVAGHRMQCPARHVHGRVVDEFGSVVFDLEGVRQLEAEDQVVFGCHPSQVVEHRDRIDVLQVVPEGLVGYRNVAESEFVVDDAADGVGAEEGRVALDRGVDAPFFHEVEHDRFDLVGRAAMHGRQRDRVGYGVRDFDAGDLRVPSGDDVDVCLLVVRSVVHGFQVPLDVGLLDAGQVVADRHVEDHAGTVPGEAELVVQGVDQHPGAQVLVERLIDLELLRPLDVVTLVLDIDAGLVDVELVQGLDRLQLDEAGSHQPGHDDVLRHLTVWSGGDTEWSLQQPAVLGDPKTIVG